MYDPFVGTGSMLVAAAHHRAVTLGADIDMRVIRLGKKDKVGQQVWNAPAKHVEITAGNGAPTCVSSALKVTGPGSRKDPCLTGGFWAGTCPAVYSSTVTAARSATARIWTEGAVLLPGQRCAGGLESTKRL